MTDQRNIGIIIQARMGSSRLPGKMLMEFYQGKSLLEVIIERIKQFDFSGRIILATTVNSKDDELVELGNKMGVNVFRGDEENVLKRFIDAAEKFKINKIIRICADNPFVDGSFLKDVIKNSSDADYCSYFLDDQTPTIKTHFGFFTEFVSLSALKSVQELTKEKLFQEHVTNYMYTNPQNFNIKRIPVPSQIAENQYIRLTIDTQNDFDLCKTIYAYFCDNGVEITALGIVDHVKNKKEYVQKMQNEIKANEK